MKRDQLKLDIFIYNVKYPEWGYWRVMSHYDECIWEIRGRSGKRILDECEAELEWEIKENQK